jgi:predicted AAA+ superfamily ATPase
LARVSKTETPDNALLKRIAEALDRIAPKQARKPPLDGADAFVWHAEGDQLEPVRAVNRVDLDLLLGITHARDTLLENTRRFAKGLPANNALLWGARGTGKSSLVKAVHATVNAEVRGKLALVEIHREDIASLPRLLRIVRSLPRRAVLFCDDLSFESEDTSYKSLKALLEGGIEGRPDNAIFYATSNRRHLMARDAIDIERAGAVGSRDATDETVSLSDRFGLWLGFHNCDQDTYFAIVEKYTERFGLTADRAALRAQANEWSVTRGARSGRVAWQFIQDLAGRQGKKLG